MNLKIQPIKPEKKANLCEHSYIVTCSSTSGGLVNALEMRCSKCLALVELEKLRWLDSE